MKKDIRIIINKSEITAGTRGASLGPEAVMTAARKKGSMLFGNYPMEFIVDENQLLDQPIKYPNAKRIEGLVKVFDRVQDKVFNTLERGEFPLVLASDHGSAGGTIAGIKRFFEKERVGVVWIDAHGDLHTPYTTPSGNMHGMPLATALGEDNLECQKNDIGPIQEGFWQALKDTGIKGAKLAPNDLCFIAVRDTEAQEDALMERLELKNHTVDEVRAKGKEVVMNEIKEQLRGCDQVYVSFDVDSMDPSATSHGTGTPVDHGLSPEEAAYFLKELAEWEKTCCMEFVEVNPCLDEKVNKMAEVTFDLFEMVTEIIAK